MLFNNIPVRIMLMLVWGLFALVLTTQSDRVPLVHLMTSTVGATEIGATLGHAGLFGILMLLVYVALAIRLPRLAALLLAMLVVGALGPLTEWSQSGLFGRDPSMTDLLADWLGIFMVGFALTCIALLRPQRAL
jgi:hypothetical protein